MEDDFSFPATTDAPPRFIGSPTLWRRSSSVAPVRSERETPLPLTDPDHPKTHNSARIRRRKSFSCVQENRDLHSADDADGDKSDDEEIKMDVLWEDFMNEEVSKSCGFLMESDERHVVGNSGHCRKQKRSFKPAKGAATGRVVLSGKRPGLFLFLRIMKKLVLFHNSNRSIKKSSVNT